MYLFYTEDTCSLQRKGFRCFVAVNKKRKHEDREKLTAKKQVIFSLSFDKTSMHAEIEVNRCLNRKCLFCQRKLLERRFAWSSDQDLNFQPRATQRSRGDRVRQSLWVKPRGATASTGMMRVIHNTACMRVN